jgi:glycerol-1-phosphate dehydrogenase [NAD(P)+]
MTTPEVFVFDSGDEDEAARALATQIRALGITNPLVLTSPHGERLAAALEGQQVLRPEGGADQHWAAELGSRARRSGAGAVIAIGGGRVLDLGKLAAARAGIAVVSVPTQLSHDGLCSPVAVVPNHDGRTESVGALAPRAVFISLPTLLQAPPAAVAAGLGDLLANPLALRDWALAAEHGLELIDQQAWDMSVHAFELVEPLLDTDPATSARDPQALKRLAEALVLSGMAMIAAGTSRPASGGEHEISHAIDELFGGRSLHGAQVAFGCIFSVALHGDDAAAFKERLGRLGLPQHPRALRLSEDELLRVLLHAPETRPGRFTILEEADLDETSARALIRALFSTP